MSLDATWHMEKKIDKMAEQLKKLEKQLQARLDTAQIQSDTITQMVSNQKMIMERLIKLEGK